MDSGSHKSNTSTNDGGVTPPGKAGFELEALLQRPVAAQFHALYTASDGSQDVFQFVYTTDAFSPQDCVDALLVDQHHKSGKESEIPAETYRAFLRNRVKSAIPELEWGLVAGEFLLTLKRGKSTPSVALQNLCSRFPEFRVQLAKLSRTDSLAETHIITGTREVFRQCSRLLSHTSRQTSPEIRKQLELTLRTRIKVHWPSYRIPTFTIHRHSWVEPNRFRNCRLSS